MTPTTQIMGETYNKIIMEPNKRFGLYKYIVVSSLHGSGGGRRGFFHSEGGIIGAVFGYEQAVVGEVFDRRFDHVHVADGLFHAPRIITAGHFEQQVEQGDGLGDVLAHQRHDETLLRLVVHNARHVGAEVVDETGGLGDDRLAAVRVSDHEVFVQNVRHVVHHVTGGQHAFNGFHVRVGEYVFGHPVVGRLVHVVVVGRHDRRRLRGQHVALGRSVRHVRLGGRVVVVCGDGGGGGGSNGRVGLLLTVGAFVAKRAAAQPEHQR